VWPNGVGTGLQILARGFDSRHQLVAEIFVHRTIRIEAETVGDLTKFVRALENENVTMSSPLESRVTLQVAVDTPLEEDGA
jgi:hypothetical protein